MEKLSEEFLATVDSKAQSFVIELHQYLINNHCTYTLDKAKSGYVLTYLDSTKHALATYIFRKSGMKIRMYLDHISMYPQRLETIPKNMKKDIQKASVCKRLLDPDACNPRCKMGYTFDLDGITYQKCRFMAFMCTVNEENQGYIKQLLEKEIVMKN